MNTQDILSEVRKLSQRRLDRVGELMPRIENRASFEQYLSEALPLARQDTDFARDLAKALHQFQQMKGR